MARKTLDEVAGQETDRERLRRHELEIRARLARRPQPFQARDRLLREEVYNRDALR